LCLENWVFDVPLRLRRLQPLVPLLQLFDLDLVNPAFAFVPPSDLISQIFCALKNLRIVVNFVWVSSISFSKFFSC